MIFEALISQNTNMTTLGTVKQLMNIRKTIALFFCRQYISINNNSRSELMVLFIMLMSVYLLCSIAAMRYSMFLLTKESSDSEFMARWKLYDVNATLCNPKWPLHFVYEPLAGYASLQHYVGLLLFL